MGFDKGHKEFHTLDMSEGWHSLPGYPPGIEEKIIAGALDEKAKHGNRTRLLRFAPGVYTTAPFVHEYWEEVFLLAGDLTVGSDAGGNGGQNFAGYASWSGTSFSAPHLAGAVAETAISKQLSARDAAELLLKPTAGRRRADLGVVVE